MRLMHCPFCGEEEYLGLKDTGSENFHSYSFCVVCRACSTEGPEAESLREAIAKSTAINSWNNRLAHQDDLALRLAFALTQPPT